MVDSEYSIDHFKSSKSSIGAMMKNPALKFVPNHLKTKNICKHAVKQLPFVIRYVRNKINRYKTQQMSDKSILKNS